jgi:hypothetical protein
VTNAVLLDEVALSEVEVDGEKRWALELTGRVNGTEDRATLLFLHGARSAGVLVSGYVLAAHNDPALGAAVREALGG